MQTTTSFLGLVVAVFLTTASAAAAADAAPAGKWSPGHYVLIGIDPGPILEAHFYHPKLKGIQKAYNWNKIEVARDRYDWSEIDADLRILAAHGKMLAFQIQYKTFQKGSTAVPTYILEGEKEFGADRTYLSHKEAVYPSIWNPKVAARFHAFLRELGKRYDRHPNFGFVNLPETAQSPLGQGTPQAPKTLAAAGYTPEGYIEAVKQNMRVLAEAFPTTVKVQYVNFGPKGALQAWADFGAAIGVGVGGPDLHPTREIPSYPIWKAMSGRVPVGAAVQFEDYYITPRQHESGLIDVRRNFAFARELKLHYLFWGDSPRQGFQQVLRMLDSPEFSNDEAGGLVAAVPVRR